MARRGSPSVQYPVCVRHLKSRKDTKLRHFFLCSQCAKQWVEEAFDGNDPLSALEAIKGYCLHCNREGTVRLYTWFLCDICDRVARSIGRNHVAERSILDFWDNHVKCSFPHLTISQNDVASLRPRRDTDATGEAPLDFLVHDERSGELILGIENKTGRSSIKDMSQFQLDLSDCDSILYHVRESNIPAYVIHAQVLESWKPPTNGFQVVGLWWTDIYRMAENFKNIRLRRDERRGAAYFGKAAFSPIDTFVSELFEQHGTLRLVEQLRKEGIPQLYSCE